MAEQFSDKAAALYAVAIRSVNPLVAPPLLAFEVTKIVRQQMRREMLPLADGNVALTTFPSFEVELLSPPELHHQALAIAVAHGLPAAYDAHYIALAESLKCDLCTDDQRLLRALGGKLPFVRGIGAFHDLG